MKYFVKVIQTFTYEIEAPDAIEAKMIAREKSLFEDIPDNIEYETEALGVQT